MKLLLLTTFVATICYVSAGKKQLLAALNAGLIPGVNGGLIPGVNGGLIPGVNAGLIPGVNAGLIPGLNGGMAAGAVPRIMAGGLNPPMVAGGGAGALGQPQFAQFVPGLGAFAVPAPAPNVYPIPVVNALPLMGIPQMAPVNPPQQPLLGNVGGAIPQQLPPQPDPLRRFRRQIEKQDDSFETAVDTQIPLPTGTTTAAPCDKGGRPEDN